MGTVVIAKNLQEGKKQKGQFKKYVYTISKQLNSKSLKQLFIN